MPSPATRRLSFLLWPMVRSSRWKTMYSWLTVGSMGSVESMFSYGWQGNSETTSKLQVTWLYTWIRLSSRSKGTRTPMWWWVDRVDWQLGRMSMQTTLETHRNSTTLSIMQLYNSRSWCNRPKSNHLPNGDWVKITISLWSPMWTRWINLWWKCQL